MKSKHPKVLHPIAGRPMVHHVLEALAPIGAEPVVVVVGSEMDDVVAAVAPHPTARQISQLGSGDAVAAARQALDGFTGDVLVLFGDTPLIRTATLHEMLSLRRQEPHPSVVVLGFRRADPHGYGRLILGPDGSLERIVEEVDATETERQVDLCNSGVMLIDGARLFDLIERIGSDNAKGEFYLTDIVALAGADDLDCAVVVADAEELVGINDRADLAAAESIMQGRLRALAQADGVTMVDPASVWLSFDTRLGPDVVLGPNVVFGPGVTVEEGAEIRAFCHLEGVTVRSGASIGPFARLRTGTEIGAGARVGNFVEIKNAVLGDGAKANHLAYIGDATVGDKANIGAGTITCNYDGFRKHRTEIGAGAFIGSNTALVAPISIGAGAIVGAGSVVTRKVGDDAMATSRAEQNVVPGAARRYRQRKAAEKAAKS